MRRQIAVLGAVALVLTACSSDDETTTPEATPSASTSDDVSAAASPSPSPSPSFTPRPAATPRLPEGFVPPSESGDSDPDDAPSDADADATEAEAAGPSSEPLGAFATSSTTADTSSPFAALAEPVARSRNLDPTASCQVLAAAGETITGCASGFVSSRGDAVFAVAVTRVEETGAVSTRLYADQGNGSMVATVGADTGASGLEATNWTRGDELISLTLGGRKLVVGWSDGASPKVVASFDGSADVTLVAGRIVQRDGGTVRVFVPGTGGGTQVATSAADPAPVDVALRVYGQWIAGDWSAMAGLATPEVIAALRSAHTTTDLFVLGGTDCTKDGEQAVCTFDSNGDRTTWRLERRDGKVQVVDLK